MTTPAQLLRRSGIKPNESIVRYPGDDDPGFTALHWQLASRIILRIEDGPPHRSRFDADVARVSSLARHDPVLIKGGHNPRVVKCRLIFVGDGAGCSPLTPN